EANNGLLAYYTTDDGLSSDIIHSIIVDQKGDLVVGTDRGVDKLFLHGGRNVMAIKSYRGTNGHPGLKTSHNACYMEESGDIWFGSTSGIFKYQVEKEVISQKTPITYISKVRLFYDDVNWKEYTDKLEHWTGVPENLVLKYSENNLVFEYFGNSLQFPAAVRYQYKLEHFDENWSPVTNLTQAKYTNLPPGNYTFLVKSSNSDRAWNEVPARFNFEISPPFWRLPLFYIIFGSLALLIIKVIYDYRLKVKVNKLMELEKVRAAEQLKIRKIMASDFHDNMGNELASITVFTNLISLKLKNKSIEVDGLLKNIEKHTRSLFNGTKDFIWSMDPANDDLSEIYMYLKDFGEELYDKTKIKFYTDFDGEEKSSRKLCPGSGRQIVLIFKEVMTNTLKHSKATACHYILNFSDESFVFTFKDNGKGLPTNAGHNNKGYGLRNIKSRAAKGKFILDIESQGKGVSIKLKGSLQSGT
ncbi:MAG: hypothetical protein OEX02_18020, partial [Cyclobacteriaceae bacterium]|nr:hypothetical protein [Cyclobacteriaceae bacterium]